MPDPVVSSADSELRAHVERVLSAHYELDCEIGRGGMGIVYRARDRRLKRTVAIKILPPELAFRAEIKTRFLREAETAAQLNHPNIVDIYSVDEADGIVYFVMAYVSGENLAKRLHDRGVLPVDEVRRVLRDVGDALAYAHERGVVHRDIKPDNIILDAESGRPMVTDFGIARAVSEGGDSRLTATGMAIGTPAYMSPEQAAGERAIDGRSDLYSLGIVAYQMLAGEPPFVAASTPAMLVKHISERPTPIEQRRADVPADLCRIVMMLLEKDPTHRLPSAAAMVVALDTGRVDAPAGARLSALGPAWGGASVPPTAGPDLQRPSAESREPRAAGYATDERRLSDGQSFPDALALESYVPTGEEIRRWEARPVQEFRRKLAPYLFVNGVIVIASIVGETDFFFITVLWSIYLAFKYAKLWADGYDWRDVFRQARDREVMDVVDDLVAQGRALFDPAQRRRLREARRARQLARRSGALATGSYASLAGSAMPAPTTESLPEEAVLQVAGQHAMKVRQATMDRDEILRLVESMPAAERSRIPDVGRSAIALHERVKALAVSLADLDRSASPGALEELEAEVARLEGDANPLDRAASEERVRRLAYLKRQRRALTDLARRREEIAGKLETCIVALQNMRFDLVRLRSGAQTYQQITSLANSAMSLADSVDSALYVADELGQVTSRRNSARSSAR